VHKYTVFTNKSNLKITFITHYTIKDKNMTKKYINGYNAELYIIVIYILKLKQSIENI